MLGILTVFSWIPQCLSFINIGYGQITTLPTHGVCTRSRARQGGRSGHPTLGQSWRPATNTFNFKELNDPVMGGKSSGNWSVQSKAGQSFGVMDGVVVNVPSLSAPGFIKTSADGKFNDVSAALSGGLKLMVRSLSRTVLVQR